MTHQVKIFKPFPFEKGQKIQIEGSHRRGDWEVVDVDEKKVSLRCPISKKTVQWNRFCYFVDEKNKDWPDESVKEG